MCTNLSNEPLAYAVFRHVCAAAAAINISIMMAANLAGFVIGLDGLQGVASSVAGCAWKSSCGIGGVIK